MKLNDGSKLSECGISHGTTLNLVMLTPCNIHVQGVDGRMHTITVPSSEPEASITLIPGNSKLVGRCSML